MPEIEEEHLIDLTFCASVCLMDPEFRAAASKKRLEGITEAIEHGIEAVDDDAAQERLESFEP